MSIKNLIKKIFYQNLLPFPKTLFTKTQKTDLDAFRAPLRSLLKGSLILPPAKTGFQKLHLTEKSIAEPEKNPVHNNLPLTKVLLYFIILTLSSPVIPLNSECAPREEYSWTYNIEKGRRQFEAKMYNDAFDSMKLALRKNPKSYEAANILAEIAVLKKDMYTAEKYFSLSLEVNDTQPAIHTSMGKIDEYFQRIEPAMSHYRKSLELQPYNPEALINMARILYKHGEKAEAEKYFKTCYSQGISKSQEIYNRAEKMRRKNPSGAVNEFKKALEINPAHIEAYVGLADAYRQLGMYDDAANIIEILKSSKPDYALAYIYLGNIYYNNKPGMKRRKYYIELAAKNYEEAIKLDPSNPDIYFHLSDIYRQTGSLDKAAELEKAGLQLQNGAE